MNKNLPEKCPNPISSEFREAYILLLEISKSAGFEEVMEKHLEDEDGALLAATWSYSHWVGDSKNPGEFRPNARLSSFHYIRDSQEVYVTLNIFEESYVRPRIGELADLSFREPEEDETDGYQFFRDGQIIHYGSLKPELKDQGLNPEEFQDLLVELGDIKTALENA